MMNPKLFKNDPISVLFSESEGQGKNAPKSCQLMKVGSFSYWEKNDMVITADTFQSMIKNFNSKVRGVDLAIDYCHNAYEEAAGWIKNLYTNPEGDQLWADIEWTPKGKACLEGKEFRYISAEFSFDYVNDDGVHFGATLYGAGLTNRPFLKEMNPLMDLNEKNKEKKVNEEQVKQLLNDAVSPLKAEIASLKEELKGKDEKINALSEAQVNRQEKEESEKREITFNEMLKEGKVVEAQREAFIKNDTAKFAELAQPIKLDTLGNSEGKPATTEQSKSVEEMSADEAEAEIEKLAQEKAKDGVTFSSAVREVLKSNPKLAEKYRTKF